MRTRVWWLIGLMAALLGSGFTQTLVLTNGDVNGDNTAKLQGLAHLVSGKEPLIGRDRCS